MTEAAAKWVRDTLKGVTAFEGVTIEPGKAEALQGIAGDMALISPVIEKPRRGGGSTITQWEIELQLDIFVVDEDDLRMQQLSLAAIDALEAQTGRRVGPEVVGFRLYECVFGMGRAWTSTEVSGEATLRKTYPLRLVLQRIP